MKYTFSWGCYVRWFICCKVGKVYQRIQTWFSDAWCFWLPFFLDPFMDDMNAESFVCDYRWACGLCQAMSVDPQRSVAKSAEAYLALPVLAEYGVPLVLKNQNFFIPWLMFAWASDISGIFPIKSIRMSPHGYILKKSFPDGNKGQSAQAIKGGYFRYLQFDITARYPLCQCVCHGRNGLELQKYNHHEVGTAKGQCEIGPKFNTV